MENKEEPLQWFAMRALYRREMRVKEQLDLQGFQSFIPMITEHKRVKGRLTHIRKPVVAGLMFVRATKSSLQEFKRRIDHFQYICSHTHKEPAKGTPIVVPDQQMEDFIRLCDGADDPMFLDPALETIAPGDAVRVVSGPFRGLTGTFQRVHGKRARHFVVELQGLLCLAVNIPVTDLEVIRQK